MEVSRVDLHLGIVSDEISSDFDEAVQYGLSWGINRYELRMLKSGRIPDIDPTEMEEVLECINSNNLNITAVSPGLFKHPVSKREALEDELSRLLPRTINLAREVKASVIIVFGFQRDTSPISEQYDEAINLMRRAAEYVSDAGMMLAIENEPGFLCDTGRNTADFIKKVNNYWVRANWDPCNSYGTDEVPYPEGYEAIKEYIINVHAKDTEKGALVECVPLGEGMIDWSGQVKALTKDQIVHHITIETHCHPLLKNSKKNVAYLTDLLTNVQ